MKTEHFPSLDLCKKLTEIGFMRTEKYYNPKRKSIEYFKGGLLDNGEYWCPSVMEMLEHISVIEGYNNHEYNIKIRYVGWKYHVEYEHNFGPKFGFQDTLPNALAEMILWLNENNYITFK